MNSIFLTKLQKATKKDYQYTYHKKSGIKMILSVFLVLIIIEIIVIHLLVSTWNSNVAWILTLVSLYAMFQVISIMKSMDKRHITINHEQSTLDINYGFACQTKIPFNQLLKIGKFNSRIRSSKSHVYLSVFDLIDANNITIELNKENILYKLYGIEKKYQSISFFIDEKDEFISRVTEVIN